MEIRRLNRDEMFSSENIQNANALLALMHGKSDSICRVFDKEVLVDRKQIILLNKKIVDKLSLHNVSAITTSVDISLKNRKVVTFQTITEFEGQDWSFENAATNSIFIQWDFFLSLPQYPVPQKHTLGLRITSSPNPSDIMKALFNGGLDNKSDFETSLATMICKVDFINNTLAEELLHVVEEWNSICEEAISKRGVIKAWLYMKKKSIANVCKFFMLTAISLVFAIAIKIMSHANPQFFIIENIVYAFILYIPIRYVISRVSSGFGNKIISKLERIMETHIFSITKGDEKYVIQLKQKAKYSKEVVLFFANIIVSIILSVIFLKL